MSKQTAVEWLVAAIWGSSVEPPLHLKVAIEQAKAMEKEQMIIFYWGGYDNGYIDNGKLGEEYYNEKYGGDNV